MDFIKLVGFFLDVERTLDVSWFWQSSRSFSLRMLEMRVILALDWSPTHRQPLYDPMNWVTWSPNFLDENPIRCIPFTMASAPSLYDIILYSSIIATFMRRLLGSIHLITCHVGFTIHWYLSCLLKKVLQNLWLILISPEIY